MASLALLLAATSANIALAQTFASTTTFDFAGNTFPTGLVKSDWPVEDEPLSRLLVPENVRVQDGFMELLVPGGQSESPILCAEVATEFRVQSASVRTYAILTDEHGVVNGMFHYHNVSQETDIEWLSDPESFQNIEFSANGSRPLMYTNQGPNGNVDAITVSGRAPTDATTAVHEYRLDWTPDATRFYLDGVLHQTQTRYVPSAPGEWYWNN
ncbi:Beta-glucanase [Pseudocercospora fuligena]|uniref:Beta-glucanase n=1 Tax=Pseudocercospora fuligena TaxID=685502 RepID=A0A8H6VRH5_9PEZI|nr:Beta-glucanase [Pseudocercospora fuligena]